MFFVALLVFSVVLTFLPWWGVIVCSVGVAVLRLTSVRDRLSAAVAAGVSHAALSFYNDGRVHGLISARLGPLFQLPQPEWLYVLTGVLTFVTVFLWMQGASWAREQVLQLKSKSEA